MDSVCLSRFISIYRGPSHTYKVQRLTEFTCYSFRIQAASEAGEGPFSETYTFSTTKSVPPTIKGSWTVYSGVLFCESEEMLYLEWRCSSDFKYTLNISNISKV